MKVIDKTPYQDEKGNFGPMQRFQSMLEYGPSWISEVQAQQPVIAQLERVLEKGYTIIRNLNLENSKIIEPLILVGPAGVFVLYITPVTGFYEAKGDEWNIVKGERRTPASVNVMQRVGRLARAIQVFLNRQGVYLPGVVEPVLIASNPGVHIESSHPIVRIVLSDAIKQFAASLLQTRPILKSEGVQEVVDHLINPRRKAGAVQPEAQPLPPFLQPTPTAPPARELPAIGVSSDNEFPVGPPPEFVQQPEEAPQRARAIFQAAEEAQPFDPADLSFDFDDRGAAATSGTANKAKGARLNGPATGRRGLSSRQWLILVIMMLVELVVLAGFVYLLFFALT